MPTDIPKKFLFHVSADIRQKVSSPPPAGGGGGGVGRVGGGGGLREGGEGGEGAGKDLDPPTLEVDLKQRVVRN